MQWHLQHYGAVTCSTNTKGEFTVNLLVYCRLTPLTIQLFNYAQLQPMDILYLAPVRQIATEVAERVKWNSVENIGEGFGTGSNKLSYHS